MRARRDLTVARASIFVLAIVVSSLSCQKGNPTQFAPPGTLVTFRVGGFFSYQRSITTLDSVGNILFSDSTIVTAVVEASGDSIGGYGGLLRFRGGTHSEPPSTVWYSLSDTAFLEIAYKNPGQSVAFPRILETDRRRLLTVLRRTSLLEPLVLTLFEQPLLGKVDTPIVRSEPRIVYLLPLSPNASWRSFSAPFRQDRTVVGDTMITVQGAPYFAMKIKTTVDIAPDNFEWFDYVGSVGLLMRIVRVTASGFPPEGPAGGEIRTTVIERLDPLEIRP